MEYAVDEGVPLFAADSEKLRRIVENLASNAVKFTPPGGSIEVAVRHDASRKRIVFEVSDTGVGIAEEDRERIFDRFTQVDGSTERLRGGSGLGLALVRELAEMHGGSVSVASSVGEGSTFSVEIPSDLEAGPLGGTHHGKDHAHRRRRELQLALAHVVQGEGYAFCCAANGHEGLEMLEREKPDLLLLDVMMPGMNGYDVCERMRARGRRIPVIFLTAKGDIVDKGIGFKAGADDYLVKPFNNGALLMRIEAHLRRHRDDLAFARATAKGGNSCVGDLEIRFSSYEVLKGGQPLDLTAKEFEILALLAANPGKVYTRQQIYAHIWGDDTPMDENSITVFIHRIREKIEQNPSKPKFLLTVWGVGYKFAERLG